MKKSDHRHWEIWIDTGGTFTDCIAISPEKEEKRVKVLSNSSLRGTIVKEAGQQAFYITQDWEAPDQFIQGFRFRFLQQSAEAVVVDFNARESRIQLDRNLPLVEGASPSFEVISDEEAPILAARLVTSTPAGFHLPPLNMRLATTRGTNALLEKKGGPTALFVTKGYKHLLEIDNQQRPDLFALNVIKPGQIYDQVIEVPERVDARGNVLESLDISALERETEQMLKPGISSVAVAFMNSVRNPVHEVQFKKWLRSRGHTNITISSDLTRFIRMIPRARTTLVNAYLAPIIVKYLAAVQASIPAGNLYVMTSAGGLTQAKQYTPKDSLLSGPAGGVVGAAAAGKQEGFDKVISFDMGGTSTDVARFDKSYEYVFEHQVGNARLVAPALYIETVAAGGGSICYYDGFKLCVGPESAGAHPGPACYGAGGPLTITDVNLLMGRLDPKNFHIPVVIEDAEKRLDEIVQAVNRGKREKASQEMILSGFLHIANERMADAIRKISIRKGYDTGEYALAAFGGAGAQHACAIARQLNMDSILISEHAGILSAWGLGHAVMEEFEEKQLLQPLDTVKDTLKSEIDTMAVKAREKLQRMLGSHSRDLGSDIRVRRKIISMRLEGQESSLTVEYRDDADPDELFKKAYVERYGHWVHSRRIEVESIRVIASTSSKVPMDHNGRKRSESCEPSFYKAVWFDGEEKRTPVYHRADMLPGNRIKSPALILDPHSTIVVEPGWEAVISSRGTIQLQWRGSGRGDLYPVQAEAVMLELFTNRFRSITEEMGEMLQRTALSVNVKERLDFSCALLNSEGELVVNAPHIPVHLGALGLCVRSLIKTMAMEPGDVVVTNHPAFGGSHLPDVTVVTPVYTSNRKRIGYVASRAHHAEIGGKSPGSMPPDARNLEEEGVVIPPMYLIRKGIAKWDDIRAHLLTAKYPTRDIEKNIADLQAAVAANHRGAEALCAMAEAHGPDKVQHYMNALKGHTASRMRSTLKSISNGTYTSEEFLDDGSLLKATLMVEDESVQIDFTGTAPVHPGNLNATPAIVYSVVMYLLRLLIDEPLPLNEGLLDPVQLLLPTCMLNPDFGDTPSKCPAVVGGNVEVSQRLVDTLLKPFERVACSQGTMNNTLFGNDNFGYYETVGGGTGAGPGFHGVDAVHQHMTNTRGTDPEVLEHYYPVRLDRYQIRKDSGGDGEFRGGSGIIREMTFLEPVRLTVLTQHRKEKPYGMRGGEPGKCGEQWVVYGDGQNEQLKSVDGRSVKAGDRFILKTPGGGGYGTKKPAGP